MLLAQITVQYITNMIVEVLHHPPVLEGFFKWLRNKIGVSGKEDQRNFLNTAYSFVALKSLLGSGKWVGLGGLMNN